jgi:hypothetical protein
MAFFFFLKWIFVYNNHITQWVLVPTYIAQQTRGARILSTSWHEPEISQITSLIEISSHSTFLTIQMHHVECGLELLCSMVTMYWCIFITPLSGAVDTKLHIQVM